MTYTDFIPRCLPLSRAAAYVGLSTSLFQEDVRDGKFPKPLPYDHKTPVWDRVQLDQAIDRLARGTTMTPAEKARARIEKRSGSEHQTG